MHPLFLCTEASFHIFGRLLTQAVYAMYAMRPNNKIQHDDVAGAASRERLFQHLLLVPSRLHSPHSVHDTRRRQRRPHQRRAVQPPSECFRSDPHQRHEEGESPETSAAVVRGRRRPETTVGMPTIKKGQDETTTNTIFQLQRDSNS